MRVMLLAVQMLLAGTAIAAPRFDPSPLNAEETANPAVPAMPDLRERARIQDALLRERLETVVPRLMRETGIDMWVLLAREYAEDPVLSTMLDAENFHARRQTILVFFDPGGGKPVERLTVSRYGLAGLFEPAWAPEKQPDQWARLAEIIAARNPRRIAVNMSSFSAHADGLTHTQHEMLLRALPQTYRSRVVSSEPLAIGWLETRTPAEMERYAEAVRTAHAIIAEGFSDKVIVPGKTTAEDVVWWFRERIAGLKLDTWFQPSVSITRQGVAKPMEGDEVIRPGDMLWCDFGIIYLRLHTDTQHLAYVLKPGETDAPAGLKEGLAQVNAVEDALTSSFAVGQTGNALLEAARAKAIGAGLKPTIYSHPIGYHGHAAGAAIGFWDDQKPGPRGDWKVRADTAWSIELNTKAKVPEWGGQEVEFRLEEDAFFDGGRVRYIDGRETRFHLIGTGGAVSGR